MGLKTSTNKIYAGQHWTKRKSSADAILSIATYFCRPIQSVKSYPVEISYRFVFTTRALDTTNCSYMVKMFEDALRTLKVIEDDSPLYVAKTIIESVVATKGKISKSIRQESKKNNEKDEDHLIINIKEL